jgi:hypothetical protein
MPEEKKLIVEPYNGYHSEIKSHVHNMIIRCHCPQGTK